jgi:hypothetical protein
MPVNGTTLSPPLAITFNNGDGNQVRGQAVAFQWKDASFNEIDAYWVIAPNERTLRLVQPRDVTQLSPYGTP